MVTLNFRNINFEIACSVLWNVINGSLSITQYCIKDLNRFFSVDTKSDAFPCGALLSAIQAK